VPGAVFSWFMGTAALNPLSTKRPAELIVATMVAVTIAGSPPVLDGFAQDASPASWLAMLCITGTLAALLGRWAARAKQTVGTLVRVLLGGYLAGWLNSVLCFIAWGSFSAPLEHGVLQVVAMSPFVAIVGFVIGGPIGFGYGCVLLIPTLLAHRLQQRSSPEATDRCLAGAGLWAAAVAFGLAALVLRAEPAAALSLSARVLALVACLAVGALASMLTILTGRRLWHRRAWLARVRAGLVPDWVVVPRDTWRPEELQGVEPLLVTSLPDAVLASATGEMGYRAVRRLRPRALVAGTEGEQPCPSAVARYDGIA
jgi:hypothetical protein